MHWWYRIRWGVTIGAQQSMFPDIGYGRFISLYKKGPFYDLVDETRQGRDFIRLIPY